MNTNIITSFKDLKHLQACRLFENKIYIYIFDIFLFTWLYPNSSFKIFTACFSEKPDTYKYIVKGLSVLSLLITCTQIYILLSHYIYNLFIYLFINLFIYYLFFNSFFHLFLSSTISTSINMSWRTFHCLKFFSILFELHHFGRWFQSLVLA